MQVHGALRVRSYVAIGNCERSPVAGSSSARLGRMGGPTTFWDREVIHPRHSSWMADQKVREYVNEAISGRPGDWPLDWFQKRFPRKFNRALSIGCGTGALERDLVKRGICRRIDAFDGSVTSLLIAAEEARKSGGGICYFAADFNEPVLPRSHYDLVLVHQALHHVAKLEKLYRAIMRTLEPGGVLYIDEYVGPSRFEWNDELIDPQRRVYDSLPEDVRLRTELPFPYQPDDPSEAFRSSEVIPLLEIGFSIEERRDYGGNVLSVLFPSIDWQRADAGLIRTLIERERELLAEGASSYHAVVVARPRTGLLRLVANARYFAEPKAKRIVREARSIVSRFASLVRRGGRSRI
jgi:SAM-dependent methyltransferase